MSFSPMAGRMRRAPDRDLTTAAVGRLTPGALTLSAAERSETDNSMPGSPSRRGRASMMGISAPAPERATRRATAHDRARRQRDDQRLMLRHRGGDARARDELIERYMPLARSLALRYRRASEPLDDLVQVAAVGLVKAVDRWDPERGLAFSSYAVPTILGEIRRYFRDATWDVRPARDLQELCLSVEEAREKLWAELGRSPTVADLADRLDRSPEEIVEALQATEGRSARSLDAPVHEEEGDSASAGDLLGDDDAEYERVEAGITIERLTGILDDRAREILRLRFQDDLLQSEIAERVGCSQMHVSRIIRSSLERLYAYGNRG
jgi:RNA polymerase sigma-B factor